MRYFYLHRILLLLFISVLLSTSCGTIRNQESANQTSASFSVPGYPEVRIYVVGLINLENKSVASVSIDLNLASIVGKMVNNQFEARLQLELTFTRQGDTDSHRVNQLLDLSKEKQNPTSEQYRYRQYFELDPGNYTILAQLTDEQTQKTATVSAQVIIPDLSSDEIQMTDIAILVKEQHDFVPFTSSIVPSRFDSIQVYSQLFSHKSIPDSLIIRFERLRADSLAARPVYARNYSPGQLGYSGVDYSKTSITLSEHLTLERNKDGFYEINHRFKMLPLGNYLIHLTAFKNDSVMVEQKTSISVRPPYFPTLKTARELAEPLIYLMDEKEYQAMMAITNPDSLKMRVDLFWISNLKTPQLARQVLQYYYERVESANKRFTNFKEGWKTDAGMVYILFGTPRAVDESFRDVYWAYGMYQSLNSYDPERTFIFREMYPNKLYFPFDHYVLFRSNNYFQINHSAIDEWLTGYVLQVK